MTPIFVVFAFATRIVAIAIVSTIVAKVAFVASSSSFAIAAIFIVSLEIVKSSGEGLERLLKFGLERFDFVGDRFCRFNPSSVDSDFCVELLCGHCLELRAFCVDKGLPFVRRDFIDHESIEKFEVDDRFFHVPCVGRFVVINVMNKLLKLVDVVVDCGFLVHFEVREVVGGADVFEVGGAAVLIAESFPDSGYIVLYVV